MNKFLLAAPLAVVCVAAHGQAISVNGGAIQGTITDASGAAVSGANITIKSLDQGTTKEFTTDKAGFYSIGPLNPGPYTVTVSAPGFQQLEVKTTIRTGTATPGTFKLQVGQNSETVEVTAGAIQVNTDQAGVSDVITREQIDTLPVNGRNFLDLAQIEPGVVLQQGSSFDPTKTGYTGISVNGVSGRTTRIILDGQDITDEFVGTTLANVSQGAVNEFQLNRSTQDVSGEVTSQGQVLVSTRSGTNTYHGQLFYNFQDGRALFANQTQNGSTTANPPFQRNQFGGSVGGPIWKDKLFFFGNSERIQQKAAAPNALGALFANSAISKAVPFISSPFKETYSTVRLDHNGLLGGHYFARGFYDVNAATNAGGATNYAAYSNRDNTYGLAFGADYAFGKWTHSLRGSYEKFHNLISDSSAASGYDPLTTGAAPFAVRYAAQNLYFGPNANAPQGTFQSDKQFRYDGGTTVGRHNIRFGAAFNRLQAGGFANFYGVGPRANLTASNLLSGTVNTVNTAGLGCNGIAGAASCPDDPINGYNLSSLTMGNGLGGFSENPGFGLPNGGFSAYRYSLYLSDSFKVTPHLTIAAGLRYSVDTNRQNNNVLLPNCSDLSATVASACTGLNGGTKIFSLFNSSYADNYVNQDYNNVGPQIGFNWAPGNSKTSFRGGFGIFYESVVFNNTSNARSNLQKSGAYYFSANPCTNGRITFPDGTIRTTTSDGQSLLTLCRERTVRQSYPALAQFYRDFQANAAANSVSANNAFIGNSLSASGLYAPKYKQPYSEQWNFGIQRELFKGAVLSADYVHNSTLRIGQTIDQNHLGAARTFSLANAQAAITAAATGTTFGVCANANYAAVVSCMVSRGATIQTFAAAGLDSAGTYTAGTNFRYNGRTSPAAFPGINQNLGSGAFIAPTGRSGYDALQVVYRQSASHPIRGIESSNLQIAYNLSRIVSNLNSADEFFSSGGYDNDNPSQYIGRNSMDRKHQINIGGSFLIKYGPRISGIGHFYSAAPASLSLDTGLLTAGNIYQSDLSGDGTTGDLAPGTLQGDYMRRLKGKDIPGYISTFNGQYAGKVTPAGQKLIDSGYFTMSQLTALNGVIQPIGAPAANVALQNPTFRTFDISVSYPVRLGFIREGMSLEPQFTLYNIGNFSNFSGITSGVLNSVTTANQNSTPASGTTPKGAPNSASLNSVVGPNDFASLAARRTTRGTGTFAQGAPRSAEFQLKLNF